jgi:hypothetical protein
VWGGDGDDALWAMARKDVTPGPNGEVDTTGDTIHAEGGDDRIRVRDGEVDTIECGDGHDIALLDAYDVIADASDDAPMGSCEKVVRKAPRPGEDNAENQEEPQPAS